MPFEWIGTILAKYQSLGEHFDGKSSPFSNICSMQVCKVRHTTDIGT